MKDLSLKDKNVNISVEIKNDKLDELLTIGKNGYFDLSNLTVDEAEIVQKLRGLV